MSNNLWEKEIVKRTKTVWRLFYLHYELQWGYLSTNLSKSENKDFYGGGGGIKDLYFSLRWFIKREIQNKKIYSQPSGWGSCASLPLAPVIDIQTQIKSLDF